jgi:hypothetical protein
LVTIVSIARSSGGEPRELDARKSADTSEESFKKGDALGGLAVLHFGEIEVHGEHVFGDAAEIGGTRAFLAFQHEAGTDEQNDGEADLDGEQTLADLGLRTIATVRTRGLLK